jgi:hypothetical protein
VSPSEQGAADAYYHKNGFGFQQLLETISELMRNLPHRAALPAIDNEPVQARWDGNGQYIIGCRTETNGESDHRQLDAISKEANELMQWSFAKTKDESVQVLTQLNYSATEARKAVDAALGKYGPMARRRMW